MTKTYICGICEDRGKSFKSTRKELRKHLREEHLIKSELANKGKIKGVANQSKQKWWRTEEWE